MVRPRTSMTKSSDEIRDELISEIRPTDKDKSLSPVKNVYSYHPDCPYSNSKGIVAESHYVYWKYYPKDIIHKDEVIAHLNKDRTDNRIENLAKWKKIRNV
jgi:hypothetical protein